MDSNRIFGGNPLGIILRLVVLSIVVGIVMSALDLRPVDLIDRVAVMARRIYGLGFGAIEGAAGYFLLGALIVVPIWLITRLVSAFRRRDGNNP